MWSIGSYRLKIFFAEAFPFLLHRWHPFAPCALSAAAFNFGLPPAITREEKNYPEDAGTES